MTTTQEQALLDAALAYDDGLLSGHDGIAKLRNDLHHSIEAYRASIVPKECRPPSSAKNCSWWWLRGPMGIPFVAFWRAGAWAGDVVSSGPDVPPERAAKLGWTVRSECVFPGDEK